MADSDNLIRRGGRNNLEIIFLIFFHENVSVDPLLRPVMRSQQDFVEKCEKLARVTR